MGKEDERTEQQKFWDLAVEDIKNCTPPGHDIDRRWSNAIAKSNGDMERAKSIYRKNIVWQMMNFKHLGLYVLVGIVSGGICTWMWEDVVGAFTVQFYLLAITLAMAILVAGRYISDIQFRSGWLSPAILIVACGIGWHFAYEFGSKFHTHDFAFIGSGAIGGICVSIGLALAWKLSRPTFAITVISMAGALGGLVFMFIGELIFILWQPILLLGIGIAVQIDSAKSSAEQ